jgi:hypothetical protein
VNNTNLAHPELLYNGNEAICYEALRLQHLQQESSVQFRQLQLDRRLWFSVAPGSIHITAQKAALAPPSFQAACLSMQNAALAGRCAKSGTCPLQESQLPPLFAATRPDMLCVVADWQAVGHSCTAASLPGL